VRQNRRTTFTASTEARADRSLGQTKANLHSVVHVRLTETFRILRQCKPTEKKRKSEQVKNDCANKEKKSPMLSQSIYIDKMLGGNSVKHQ
jgi:hypothetical protein